MFNRSRRRLTYWFALYMGSILVLFAGVVHYREVDDQLKAFDQTLYRKSRVMAAKVRYHYYAGRWLIDLAEVPLLGRNAATVDSELVYARWYAADGRLVYFVGVPASQPLEVKAGFQTINRSVRDAPLPPNQWLRQVTLPVLQDGLLVGYLQIATPLEPVREHLNQRRLFLALGVPVTLAFIGVSGWILGGVALYPIRQAYDQLQRFTADASHELRAPLAAAMSNAQVGLLAPIADAELRQQRLEKIVELTKSMSALISNLLFLARHEGPLAPETLKSINLVELLQQVVTEYEPLLKEQSLQLSTQFPDQPVMLNADPELLARAIGNLFNNAIKYTPANGTLYLRLVLAFRRVMIQVEDTGIGIPEQDLPHVFDRFYRVDTARSRQTGGFGLGLSIAKQIVEAHQGRLSVKSKVGEGSMFQIELPLRS